MHDSPRLMWWSTVGKRDAFESLRTAIAEFFWAAGASARYDALRCQGATRASIGRRIFEEFYSPANIHNHRPRRT